MFFEEFDKPHDTMPRPLPRNKKNEIEEIAGLQTVPIADLTCHDILLGRGNAVAHSEGNVGYRAIIWQFREVYVAASRDKKQEIAQQVIDQVYALDPPGRFLEYISEDMCREVPHARILEKCCQSLREKKYKKKVPETYLPSLRKQSSTSSTLSKTPRRASRKKRFSPRKAKTVASSIQQTAKHEPPTKRDDEFNLTQSKIGKQPKTRNSGADAREADVQQVEDSNSPYCDEKQDATETEMDIEEETPICDNRSFINAKKLLLGKKVRPSTTEATKAKPPPLEQPAAIESTEQVVESVEESENEVFDGMFNMLPLSLVEFYATSASDDRIHREKTREESIESPTTVMDDFGFLPPVPLQMAHSLYLEGESKWVNPADNVTANVVAAWTEFATSGAFARYG
ncbi:hypothetical protein FisN_8Hh284 [Fistulifera solaris]|jgi:hypothetical protein|uniref:DUF6824 domain-containing protein n=1 Tax=Fistulifera solaris TaxID=1519565 RepID=A0A1Z5JYZ9_FISSO|nr:hypothetical protein FisN_8Hh284 [Fistulifera solaris]|eukprot:GAX19058.1 hypothetical protein FisN_8Hh284 [Fistulifera solaris]